MKKKKYLYLILVASMLCLSGCEKAFSESDIGKNLGEQIHSMLEDNIAIDSINNTSIDNEGDYSVAASNYAGLLENIPEYCGEPYVVVNENLPYYNVDDFSAESFEYYSELDDLGRCGVTYAVIGKDIMPTEERGEIGHVKPTGWHTVKYDIVEGNYLYNRCHLIGYQLTGENANVCNLITGTRAFNVEGMLPFENEVADYVRNTGNHVIYRVTPVFEAENLLADGVLMEAYSIEDDGYGVCFNVFVYNVQSGIEINYKTGESWFAQ